MTSNVDTFVITTSCIKIFQNAVLVRYFWCIYVITSTFVCCCPIVLPLALSSQLNTSAVCCCDLEFSILHRWLRIKMFLFFSESYYMLCSFNLIKYFSRVSSRMICIFLDTCTTKSGI